MPAGKAAAAQNAGPAGQDGRDGFRYVRPAGPETMRDPPDSWDKVDEAVDATFPGSDPPAFSGTTGASDADARPDAGAQEGQTGRVPSAGPHAQPELTNAEATPGTGVLPPIGDEEDPNAQPTG